MVLAAALGGWVMAAPGVLATPIPLAAVERILGPLVTGLSVASASPLLSKLRLLQLPLAATLVIAAWFCGADGRASANSVCAGIALASLVVLHRQPHGRYGGGWAALAPLIPVITRGAPAPRRRNAR